MAQALLKQIASIRTRVVTLVWLRAVLLALAVFGTAVLAMWFVDWLMDLRHVTVNWMLFVASIVSLTVVVLKWLAPAIKFQPTNVSIARRIEQHGQGWSEELSTSVGLAQSDRATDDSLESNLIQTAYQRLQQQSVTRLVDSRVILKPFLWFLAVVVLIGSLSIWQQDFLQVAASRTFTPWQNATWPRDNQLQLRVPESIQSNEPIDVVVRDVNQKLNEDVWLEYRQAESSTTTRVEMSFDSQGSFTATVPGGQQDVLMRAQGGDDLTDWVRIDVVTAPRILSVQTTVLPPEGLSLNKTVSDGAVDCWAGSQLLFRAVCDLPLTQAFVVIADQANERRIQLQIDDRQLSHQQPIQVDTDGEFWFELVAEDGTASMSPQRWPIQMKVDQAATAILQLGDSEIGVNSVLNMECQITDDLPIEEAWVRIDIPGEPSSVIHVNLPLESGLDTNDRVLVSGQAIFDFENSDLVVDQTIELSPVVQVGQRRLQLNERSIRVVAEDQLLGRFQKRLELVGRQLSVIPPRQQLVTQDVADLKQQVGTLPRNDVGRLLELAVKAQQRIIDDLIGTDSTSQRFTAINEYAARHRLDPQSLAVVQELISIHETQIKQHGDDMSRMLQRLSTQVAIGQGIAKEQLQNLNDQQERLLRAVVSAATRLNVTVSVDQLVAQAMQLQSEQTTLQQRTDRFNQLSLTGQQPSGINVQQTLSEQRAVKVQFQQLQQNLGGILDSIGTGQEDESLIGLQQADAILERNQVARTLLQIEQQFQLGRFDIALQQQATVANAFQEFVEALSPSELDDSPTSPAITNRLSGAIERLRELESDVADFARQADSFSEQDRQQLNSQKSSTRQTVSELGAELTDEQLNDIRKLIDAAEQLLADGSGTTQQQLENERDQIQEAIANLQQAALGIDAAAESTETKDVDLRTVLDSVLQIKLAQQGINVWCRQQFETANVERVQPETQPPASLVNEIGNVQTAARGSLRNVNSKLAKYQLSGFLIEPILVRMDQSRIQIQSVQFDADLMSKQQTILDGIQQLQQAIEIQLAANQDGSEVNTETESENSQNQEATEGRISSFELSMLYVAQQAIMQETKALQTKMTEAGEITDQLQRTKANLASRQKQLSELIQQLLSKDEAIPELPDF